MTYEESQILQQAEALACDPDATPEDIAQALAMVEVLGEDALAKFKHTLGETHRDETALELGADRRDAPEPTDPADPDRDSFDYYDEDVADLPRAPEAFKQREQLLRLRAKLKKKG